MKIFQTSAPVVNVVAGQNATHEPTRGPRYHSFDYICTVTKTGLTAGNVFIPTVDDAIGRISVFVNDVLRREHLSTEVDYVQTRWDAKLAVATLHNLDNDLLTAKPDLVGVNSIGGNANNTTRTSTFIVTVNFAEQSRSNTIDREKFAWPTAWPDGTTVKLAVKLAVPNNAGCTSPAIRCTEVFDYQLGSVVNGKNVMLATAWIRMEETYKSTSVTIRKWPFTGVFQQATILSPTGDDVATFNLKNGNNIIFGDVTKAGLDYLANRHGWNPAGTNADACDAAADFSDNPGDAIPISDSVLFEMKLKLTQAAAGNPTLVIINQVYQDFLSQ